MSGSDARPIKGEILAPGGSFRPDQTMTVSLLARIRNQIVQKELTSYAAKARAWNDVVMALRDGERLRREYEAELIRSSHLPLLRAAEEMKVHSEVHAIFDAEEDRRLERQLVRTTKQAALIRAKRELEELEQRLPKKPDMSPGKRKVEAIRKIREERDEMIAIIMNGRDEAALTDEDRRTISNMRLAAEDECNRVLEERRE